VAEVQALQRGSRGLKELQHQLRLYMAVRQVKELEVELLLRVGVTDSLP
jgi:hypothetical protein